MGPIVFDPEEFDSALDDLEVRLERLNLRYERFFSGSERTEPAALREEIDHQLAQLLVEQNHLGPLARVRLTLVQQRYDGYQQSWKRQAGRASPSAHERPLFSRESAPPIERPTRVLKEPIARRNTPLRATASRHLVTPITGLDGSFTRSSRPPPPGRVLTPPLGTPSTSPHHSRPVQASLEGVPRAPRPESSRTIRDFRQPLAREVPRPNAEARPATLARPAEQTSTVEQRAALERPPDGAPNVTARPLESDLAAPESAASDPEQALAPRTVSMERVREIHARLRASNGRPPSLERLAKRLSETEAKLKELHGDRTVTFDVILRDGKAIVKPIVH